ncbi:MAG: hypothetical protein Q7S13_04020 [Candidatus Omnitrophota bacterium]|nr:hypothetical protein [Candidatus Omnitrophota bacterium]
MLKDVKCLSCAHVLFRIGPLDEKGGSWGIFDDDRNQYEGIHQRQGDKEYYECPACHKKNWTAIRSVPGQGEKVWISHVTE